MAEQEDYLYRDDPKSRIARWAKSLRHFRFVRSGGGMSGGGDNLLLAVRVRTQEELDAVFAQLEVPLRASLPDPAEFGGNGSIRFEAAATGDAAGDAAGDATGDAAGDAAGDAEPARTLSPGLGQIRVGAALIHAYYVCGVLEMRIADETEPWRVTDQAVDAAREIEPRIAGFADRLIDPPQNDPLCVCPRFHPEIWESPAEREIRIARLRAGRRRRKILWWALAVTLVSAGATRWLSGSDRHE